MEHHPMNHTEHMHHDHLKSFKKKLYLSLVLTALIFLFSPNIYSLWLKNLYFIEHEKQAYYLVFVFSSLLYFYGGSPFLKGMYQEIKGKNIGMMTLIGIAISVSFFYSAMIVFFKGKESFFLELATLIDIMLVGHLIEMKSIMATGKALKELSELIPKKVHRWVRKDEYVDCPIEELKINDKLIVKPHEKIPSDGVVVEGVSSVNESLLTGESSLVVKKMGSNVIGGSINGEGILIIQVKKLGKASFLSQVIELVKTAQGTKSKTQNLANRFAFFLTIVTLAGGILTFSLWFFYLKGGLDFSLERCVTVMVTACPHALGLAIPLVVAVSTGIAAKMGLMIRNRTHFEKARKIDLVVFDKTGTLTFGKFVLSDVIVMQNSPLNKGQILQYASSIESYSEHPLAQVIQSESQKKLPVEDFKVLPGVGVSGKIQKDTIELLSQAALKERNITITDQAILQLAQEHKTTIYFLFNGSLICVFGLADEIRPEAALAIEELKKMKITSVMITGDNTLVADTVAKKLKIDQYFAEILPQDKAKKIEEIQKRGHIVAMVGDGINDAPSLAQANVGIAIGAGTDIALEAADVILVKNNPLDVVSIIKLSKKTYKKMVQNLFWATGYNIIALPLAAGVLYQHGILLTPAFGAILMSLSTIICAINAKMLSFHVGKFSK
jgi:Cu2+-exporting ATPase